MVDPAPGALPIAVVAVGDVHVLLVAGAGLGQLRAPVLLRPTAIQLGTDHQPIVSARLARQQHLPNRHHLVPLGVVSRGYPGPLHAHHREVATAAGAVADHDRPRPQALRDLFRVVFGYVPVGVSVGSGMGSAEAEQRRGQRGGEREATDHGHRTIRPIIVRHIPQSWPRGQAVNQPAGYRERMTTNLDRSSGSNFTWTTDPTLKRFARSTATEPSRSRPETLLRPQVSRTGPRGRSDRARCDCSCR